MIHEGGCWPPRNLRSSQISRKVRRQEVLHAIAGETQELQQDFFD